MNIFTSELLGTFFLLYLGTATVANVILSKTKGNGSGWIVITMGWAMAAFVGIYVATSSGAHLNPAVTISLWYKGAVETHTLGSYFGGQFLGAFLGAVATWLQYRMHFDETEDQGTQLAVFSTGPAIRNTMSNLVSEILGTFTLMAGILFLPETTTDLGKLNPLPVALLILGIGIALGGTTGYAINPARDLGPRIAHAILPIKGKGESDWGYSWIPVLGPIIGGLLAVALHRLVIGG
jgi:glycerol uptake facilitator protein